MRLGAGGVLGLTVMLALLLAPPGQAADGKTWFRGQLHSHTYWSDGRGFPEQAVAAYKERGYDFLSLTDHNRFAEDTNVWREVVATEGKWPPKISQSIFDSYRQAFGTNWVETATTGQVTSVRLRTYAEVRARFEEPGAFILLPGVELTESLDKRHLHLNSVNFPGLFPSIQQAGLVRTVTEPMTTSELLALHVKEAEQASVAGRAPSLLMLNHPFWVCYDVVPQPLIDCPQVRFFEICNGGADYAPTRETARYTPEQFWDSVNAFRRIQGQPLLYGVASDDAHYYDAKRINGTSGVGDAWIMVRAAALTPEHLIAAMRQGDFYATCGVLLDDVAFTPADNTLRVKVKAERGVKYRIHFISTKRDFDRNVTTIDVPAKKKRPARTVPNFSEDIGRTVLTVSGTEAAYRLTADDLYVRARVESNRRCRTTPYFHPKVQTAWTQPYASDQP